MSKRIVVTGLGVVSPLGIGFNDNMNAILQGRSGIDKITLFDPFDLPTKIAGEVKNFNPDLYMDRKEVKKCDRFIHLGMAAAMEAMESSGLINLNFNPERFGTYLSSGIGGLPEIANSALSYKEKGFKRGISPFFIPSVIANLLSGQASIKYNLQGPNYCMVTACSSSAHSIGEAARIIQRGDADYMLAGGAESVVSPLGIGGFNAMRALSTRNDEPTKASRPFDSQRDGFVMGEGAGIVVLEEYENAIKRNAPIFAELVGYAATADASHITAPSLSGPKRCIELSLKDAQINPEDIDYINTHGTSTPLGDVNECNAIESVFKEHALNHKLKISSTKSMTGHLLGAAGGVESIFSIVALKENMIPPTLNLENQDPAIRLYCTPKQALSQKLKFVLSNSFGFGGTNASLIFKKV